MLTLPRYTLTSGIHEGQTMLVYRGYRDADGAPVVVRIPRREPPTARDIAALWHEHTLLRELDLPGVVRAYAIEPCGDGVALVLEDPGGATLAELLDGGPLELARALEIAVAIAGILEAIHLRGVIHKDVKPHHILVRPGSSEVHLIGFGIATRLSQETQRAISPEALEGTLAYMSPEQTGRMNRVIDRRTDFYSLGVTLYEALTGTLPFPAAGPMELIHCHIARVPPTPRERAPDVPEAVSRVVMKLLAKNAEDRYQSAFGLKADLAECLAGGRAGDLPEVMPLGRYDRPDTLRVPQKLYGRAEQEQALRSAFARAGGGATELLLVTGYAGIGKSALVNEIHKAIAKDGGRFAAGKFDQLGRSVPYAPVARAFRELIRQLLGEPPDELARWREAIERAAGANGRLLIELIPELELLIGPQLEVATLGPAESQNRWNEVLTRFVAAFAATGRPLALFLDDLQWADPASLKLLEVLISDPESTHLLVIGAYRDNEVDSSHPLELTLAALRRRGARIHGITLEPLALADVIDLLTDTLGCARPEADLLAQVLLERTQSNPFYLKQFLGALHAEGLLRFDAAAGAWTWDLREIQARPATANVVDFMARKIARLTPSLQRAITLAACIGHEFDLRTLSVIQEHPPVRTAAALWEALREGLILPVDDDYRLVHAMHAPDHGDAEVPDGTGARGGAGLSGGAPEVIWPRGPRGSSPPARGSLNVRYRFLHDRVQQAAYSLIPEEQRRELHLRIGRLMLARAEHTATDDALFEIIGHLNVGAALMSSEEERREAAALNLTAGRKARAASAHEAAASYLRHGTELLSESAWDERYELALALYRERAEAEYLSGHFEEADRLYPVALARARTAMDKVRIFFVQATQLQLLGRHAEAIRIQRTSLGLLGWEVPDDAEAVAAMLDAEIGAVRLHLGERQIEDLVSAPRMERPEHRAMMELLQGMFYAAYVIGNQTLANLSLVKMTTLSLQHGSGELSPFAYIGYGMLASALLSDYPTAHRFGRMGIELSEQFDNVGIRCKASFLYAADVHSWTQPIKDADVHYDRAYALGLESGDWLTVGYMIIQSGSDRLTRGMPLAELHRICQAHLAFLQRARNEDAIDLLRAGVIQPILQLEGRTDGPLTFDGPGFSEAAYLERYRDLPYHLAWLYSAKIRGAYLFGDRARWPELVDKLALVERAVPTHTKVPETTFYAALIRIASLAGAGEEERAAHLAALARLKERLRRWAEVCPANILHKHLLVQAEVARVGGQRAEAMDLYEQGIAAAAESGYMNNEALGNELYGRFWLEQGRVEIAQIFLCKAARLYERWGAAGKVRDLEERYPVLVPSRAPIPSLRPPPPSTAALTTTGDLAIGGLLDASTLLQAGQAIAGEIELDRVLDRVMRIVLNAGGASRGCLLLAEGDTIEIQATMSVDPDVVEVGPSPPLAERDDLPATVVEHVMLTGDAVVLEGAELDTRFAGDAYLAAHRPRSLLCLALLHRGRLRGVLYLENRIAGGAFGVDRIELVRHLSSQAAAAVENALLYAHVQKVSAELRRSNERLELEVHERTEELRAANRQLVHELAERERAEAARAALGAEIIRMQEEQLLELSTPLIPISDAVVVMPLIGTMDARRAELVTETALRGAERCGARTVILDVTGMRQVDAAVAAALVRAANALRLLGARAILTGLRSEVAQTLVEIDADLRGIEIRGTLQSGIAHAAASEATRSAARRTR